MKKKTLLAGIVSGLIAFLLRRVRWKVVDSKVDASVLRWVRNLFFRWAPVQSFNEVDKLQEKTFIPKWLRYRYTYVDPDGKNSHHNYDNPGLTFIRGIPVWIARDRDTFMGHVVYVPAWWWNKVKDVVESFGPPDRRRFFRTAVYSAVPRPDSSVSQIVRSDVVWSSYADATGTLDAIPIHSEVRAKLDRHLRDINKAWDDDRNYTYSRNILLYGPKGTGKSHIALAIGVELETDIYNFPCLEKQADFLAAIRALPYFTTMICDELQEVRQFNKKDLEVKAGEFSKRDALDTLSGMFSPPGVFGVYCTNDIKEIDDRIDRKGRFKEVIYVGAVDDAGIKRWLKTNHNYDVPEWIVLREMFCMDIFDRMDTLDDAEAFVLENKL